MTVSYDPFSRQVRDDPYPTYRALREQDPVHHIESAGMWVVSRHADCLAILRDPRFSSEQGQRMRQRHDALPPSMLSTDGATHARLRAGVAPALDAAVLSALTPRVDGAVQEALQELWDRCHAGPGAVDAVEVVARPLAVRVLADLLGLPGGELASFATWAAAVAQNLDPFAVPQPGGPAEVAMSAMLDSFADHAFERVGRPRGDALTVLAQAWQGGVMAPEEAMGAAALLVVGGFEPLADLVANCLYALLGDGTGPAGAEDAGAARSAVEEYLRYDAPIQFTARVAVEEVVLHGHHIDVGDGVVVLLGSANRDPRRFAEPERCDPTRRPNPHLAFGAGPHACLGAPIARLVGRLVLRRGRRLGEGLGLAAAGPVRRDAVVPRGFLSLPVVRARPG